ncbi:Glycogen phosphorylase 1 [Forsythia ovata]|uniref:Alpha-1,4 glucan phosphorylase n=1 Tax=Forsythia ovata TaxID=205694 RepID=A0ABD1TBL3_9LAMI
MALMEAIEHGDASGGAEVGLCGRVVVVVKKAGLGLESLGDRRAKAEKMFRLMDGFLKNDLVSLEKDIIYHVEYTVARSRFSFDDFEAHQALSHSFLMGHSLSNSVINIGIRDQYADALSQLGFEFEVLTEQEKDAALGNGGLAQLLACQMDSLATLDYPTWGYGLCYQYGLFRQIIVDGFQHEQPYAMKFYGTI